MRPLIIDEKIRKELQDLRKFADNNIVTENDIKLVQTGNIPPVGDIPGHSLILPFGYRVVLSLENQKKFGLIYHASFSVPAKHKLPSTQSVCMMLEVMGLKHDTMDWFHAHIEETGPDRSAINIWCESLDFVKKKP